MQLMKVEHLQATVTGFGGRDRDRTGDLIVANDALSQLSYSPTSSDVRNFSRVEEKIPTR